MVWKHLMSYRWKQWANMLKTGTLINPNWGTIRMKNLYNTETNAGSRKNRKKKPKALKMIVGTETVAPTNLIPTRTTKTVKEQKESQYLFLTQWDIKNNKPLHRDRLFWSQYIQETASPEQKTRRTESGPTKRQSEQSNWKCSSRRPNFKLKVLRLDPGAAIDRPEVTEVPPIPKIVWQQPPETTSENIYKNSNLEAHTNTHTPELKQTIDVESRMSPMKGTSPQNPGSDTSCLPVWHILWKYFRNYEMWHSLWKTCSNDTFWSRSLR